METEYKQLVASLSSLEKNTDLYSNSIKLVKCRDLYRSILKTFPWLEGFWVRWAHTEFALNDSSAAIFVFNSAINTPSLENSLVVWVEYLKFLVRIECTCRPVTERILNYFREAEKRIGDHFLAHEYWDMYLEICDSKMKLLLHIVNNCTLHQCTKYYEQLRNDISKCNYDQLLSFCDDAMHAGNTEYKRIFDDFVDSRVADSLELDKFREVVCTKLRLQYQLHIRRVDAVKGFEMSIKRPFFHPKIPKKTESLVWNNYLNSVDDNHAYAKIKLFKRALIPFAFDESMWLKYIRYLVSVNNDGIEQAYIAGKHLKVVNDHHELWQLRNDPIKMSDCDKRSEVILRNSKDDSDHSIEKVQRLSYLRLHDPRSYLKEFSDLSFEEFKTYYENNKPN